MILKFHPVLLVMMFCVVASTSWQLQNVRNNEVRKNNINRFEIQSEKKAGVKHTNDERLRPAIKFPSIFHAFT